MYKARLTWSLLLAVLFCAVAVSAQLSEESPTGVYLVWLDDTPMVRYGGELPGLEATSPRARGERKFNSRSAAAVARRISAILPRLVSRKFLWKPLSW